jgi:hypothetical protein
MVERNPTLIRLTLHWLQPFLDLVWDLLGPMSLGPARRMGSSRLPAAALCFFRVEDSSYMARRVPPDVGCTPH